MEKERMTLRKWYDVFREEDPEPDTRVIKLDVEKTAALDLSAEEAGAVLFKQLKEETGKYPKAKFNPTLTSHETCCVAIQLCRYRSALLKSAKEIGKKTLFNSIAITTIDTFLSFFNALDYYAGLRQIELDKTPAAKMADDGGLIWLWEKAEECPPALVKGFESGKIQTDLLPLVTDALQTLLNEIFITNEEARYVSLDDFEDHLKQLAEAPTDKKREEYFLYTIRRLVLVLKDLQTAMSLRDHELYDEHPDWPCEGYEEDPSGPFDCRESRRDFAMAARAYLEEHGNPLSRFETVLDNLENRPPDDPRPFVNWQYDYSDEIRTLLSMPVSFYYDDPVGQIVFDDPSMKGVGRLNKWIVDAKDRFCIKLCKHFDNRADASPADGLARKLWTRAVAEMLSIQRFGLDRFPMDKDAADRIVNLAIMASKEEWIERRLAKKKNMPNLTDLLERQIKLSQSIVQNTERAATATEGALPWLRESQNKMEETHTEISEQLTDLQAGQSELKEGQKTIFSKQTETISRIKTVRAIVDGEHTTITKKSKKNAMRVEAVVDRYYHLVKDGTKPRIATTEACRDIEKKMGLGDYASFGSFRNAVKRVIDENNSRYGDKAVKMYFEQHPDD